MAIRRLNQAPARFGTLPSGEPVEIYTLSNRQGTEIRFLDLGGTIVSMKVPDRNGELHDITPGYDSLGEYLADSNYFGALVGRYANRIAGGRFVLDGITYQLAANEGRHALHGGKKGFDRALWRVEAFVTSTATGAHLHHTSPDGESGFPGVLQTRVTYTLTDENEFSIDYHASADRPTPVSLTQHCYFNLGGHGAGDVRQHQLSMRASHYLPVDAELIPTGELRPVKGTSFDFLAPIAIGDALEDETGFDHSWVLDDVSRDAARLVAQLHDPVSGRVLEVETTEPALQLYTAHLPSGRKIGKGGSEYGRWYAVALETQQFPDSPNRPEFPSSIVRPGEDYRSRTVYRFSVR